MNRNVDWQGAFHSIEFRKAKNNRLKFVIPLLACFTLLFLGLFSVQSYFSDIGSLKIIGEIDLGFFFVMSLFPRTGLLGIWFTSYTKAHVYPYEDLVVRTYSRKG